MPTFIAYYRVSTAQQGRSGLGLEAQQRIVADYLAQHGGQVVGQFVEVQSGRKLRREQLDQALAACRRHKATLVIAKLDRLARRVSVIASMMESGVPFVVATMPTADAFQLHIYAALAEEEARQISSRTRDALRAAKVRGVKLGTAASSTTAAKARAALSQSARQKAVNLLPVVESVRAAGATSLRAIATALEARGVRTPSGKVQWHAATVARVMAAAA